jgi:hypothetical protein
MRNNSPGSASDVQKGKPCRQGSTPWNSGWVRGRAFPVWSLIVAMSFNCCDYEHLIFYDYDVQDLTIQIQKTYGWLLWGSRGHYLNYWKQIDSPLTLKNARGALWISGVWLRNYSTYLCTMMIFAVWKCWSQIVCNSVWNMHKSLILVDNSY